jgi:hypothetical protein
MAFLGTTVLRDTAPAAAAPVATAARLFLQWLLLPFLPSCGCRSRGSFSLAAAPVTATLMAAAPLSAAPGVATPLGAAM